MRALLEAARIVIARDGQARVADVVSEAGLSNKAFYRHFASKDELVAALVEDGTERIAAATGRRMATKRTPEAKVRCWLEAMLSQADPGKAEATVAVLRISTNSNTSMPTGDHHTRAPLARLLHEPFAELGSTDPALDAELATHAIMSRVAGHLWESSVPSQQEHQRLLRFCFATARSDTNR